MIKNHKEFIETLSDDQKLYFVREIMGYSGEKEKLSEELKEISKIESLYIKLFNQIPDSVFIFDDKTFNIVEVNETAVKTYGFTKEEFKNLTPLDLHPEDELPRAQKNIKDKINYDPKRYTHITKNGEKLFVETHSTAINYKNRSASLTIIRDVTALVKSERKLKQNQEKYATFIDQSVVGIGLFELTQPLKISLSLDEQLDHIYEKSYIGECNQKYAHMFGYENSNQLNNKSISEILGKNNPDKIKEIRKFIRNNYLIENEEIVDKDLNGKKTYYNKFSIGIVENGYLIRYWEKLFDITIIKEIEQELIQSKELLEETEKITQTGGWEVDLNSNTGIITDEIYKIYEVDPNKKIPIDEGIKYYDKESQPKIIDALKDCSVKGIPFDLELKLISANGNKKWVRTTGKPQYEDGKIVRLVGILQDITDRKESEKLLKDTNERFRIIFEENKSINLIIEQNTGLILDANNTAKEFYGYLNLTSMKIQDINILNEKEVENEMNKAANREKNYFQFEHRLESGEIKDVEVYSTPLVISDRKILFSIIHDISDRIKAENDLIESEYRFKALHNASFGGITIHDKGIILECNKGLSEITGYSYNELIGMDGLKLINEETRNVVINNINLENEKAYEVVGVRKDGSEYPLRLEAKNIPYKGKNVRVVEFRDITERKKVEQEIRKIEHFRSKMIENLREVIVIIDKDEKIRYKSPNIKKLFGWDAEDYIGKSAWEKIHPSDIEKGREFIKNLVKNKNQSGSIEIKYLRKDGEYRWIRFTGINLLHDEDIKGVLGNYHDITERINTEQILINSERLSAIGEMSSAVAHDFNNSLQVIFGNLELANLKINENHPIRLNLDVIKTATEDAANRVQLLQRLSGKSKKTQEFGPVDINNIIREVVIQTRPLWKDKAEQTGKKIVIETNLEGQIYVNGNASDLRMALFNLVKNSTEAISGNGKIIITTGEIENSLESQTEEVFIQIEDSGSGIPENIRSKVFQPFFTTRGYETGRGMGLSGVYSIIREHNGHIFIKETEVNRGTVFQINLTKTKDKIKKQNNNLKSDNNIGDKKMLWVDDDEKIRQSAIELFKMLKYNGEVVGSGLEALEIMKEKDFDLVITDIGMPDMNGWELIEKIKDLYGVDFKIIVTTGWGGEITQDQLEKFKINGILTKPFRIKELQNILNTQFK